MIHVAKLSPIEKLAVDLIRGCRPARLGPDACGDFVRLACEARRAGMVISALDSPYLGDDEAVLLGLLALLQRRRSMLAVDLDPALLSPLAQGAASLAVHGIKLDYRNVARMSQGGPVHTKRGPRDRRSRPSPPRPPRAPTGSGLH